VGSFPDGASPYGALDMAGNAWEWVADSYDPAYYSSSPAEKPPGPPVSVNDRVIRGGAWNTAGRAVRSANRFWAFPRRDYFDGFRCAASE
jgi:formylglycine-generating enzyme required for sulfatase activity